MLRAGADESGAKGVIFDVGAHIGETALALALEFPNCKIHAFEPVSAIFKHLRHNCRKFGNIQCHQLALGASKEVRRIQLRSADPLCSMNQMSKLASGQTPAKLIETIHITTIDQIVVDLQVDNIALLKIDVEGFELEVLRGAMTLLKGGKVASIMAEVTFTRGSEQHVHIDDLNSLLCGLGYDLAGYYDPAYRPDTGELHYTNALFRLKV
jgi:FkbM family methyltransferase